MGQELPPYMHAQELPPTLTDVLMCDLRLTANVDLHLGELDGQSVTEQQLTQVIDFYVATPDSQIRGYRPVTHKRFLSTLSAPERTQLAGELIARLREHGFHCPATN